VLNAANEIAVKEFLAGRLPFTAIARVIEQTLQSTPGSDAMNLEAVMQADAAARRKAGERVLPGRAA
jgi:1-deoxy-D-xylulose-5-phosphate reductoisomerase